MATYKPYGNKELQDLLQQAKRQNLPVLTRHQRTEGIGIDFQNWNRIRKLLRQKNWLRHFLLLQRNGNQKRQTQNVLKVFR